MPSLYVTEPGARLEIEAGRLLVTREDEVLLAAPAGRVDQVVLVAGAHVTTPALGLLLDRGIGCVFLTRGGVFRGRLDPDRGTQIALRQAQYRRADDAEFTLAIARAIVAGKIRNARTLCLRLDETNAEPTTLAAAAALRGLLDDIPAAPGHAALMGIEGRAARLTFGVYRVHLRPPWTLPRRARRPPPDPVNAVLALVYTLRHERCRTAVIAAGLDPLRGFLHRPRHGRASLALDLMEEFRPVIADSVVLTLFNKRMLTPADFRPGPDGEGVLLDAEGWRAVAEQFARRLATGITLPDRATRTTYQKLLEVQARRLRRVIVGEEEVYEPFRSR
jgi:CRISPR-associated protein Cas1